MARKRRGSCHRVVPFWRLSLALRLFQQRHSRLGSVIRTLGQSLAERVVLLSLSAFFQQLCSQCGSVCHPVFAFREHCLASQTSLRLGPPRCHLRTGRSCTASRSTSF